VTTKLPNAKSVEDAQSVFDALDAYLLATQWTTANSSASGDGGGTTHTMNCSDRQGNNYTYTERIAGVKVSIMPTFATLGPGEMQQFTATATNPDGTPLTGATFVWSLGPGAHGTIDQIGRYGAPASIATAAMDTVTATLQSGTIQAWASVTVQLTPPPSKVA
jgi:hypothetical protein